VEKHAAVEAVSQVATVSSQKAEEHHVAAPTAEQAPSQDHAVEHAPAPVKPDVERRVANAEPTAAPVEHRAVPPVESHSSSASDAQHHESKVGPKASEAEHQAAAKDESHQSEAIADPRVALFTDAEKLNDAAPEKVSAEQHASIAEPTPVVHAAEKHEAKFEAQVTAAEHHAVPLVDSHSAAATHVVEAPNAEAQPKLAAVAHHVTAEVESYALVATQESHEAEVKAEFMPTVVEQHTASLSESRVPDVEVQVQAQHAVEAVPVVQSESKAPAVPHNNHVFFDGNSRVVYVAPQSFHVMMFDAATKVHVALPFNSEGPTTNITCIAQNPQNKNEFALGSSDPWVTVIDTSSGAVTKLPTAWKANIKTVTAIAYTVDGRYVVAAGASGEGDKNYMLAWEVKADRRQDLCIPAVQNARVSCIAGLSKEPSEFCAVGEATVGFYKIDGANFYSRVANFEEFDPNTVFSNVGYTERGTAVIGAQNGAIYAFIGASCKRVFAKVLPGPIESLLVPMTMDGTQLVITGGHDQVVVCNAKMEPVHQFALAESGSVSTATAKGFALHGSTLAITTDAAQDNLLLVSLSQSVPEVLNRITRTGGNA